MRTRLSRTLTAISIGGLLAGSLLVSPVSSSASSATVSARTVLRVPCATDTRVGYAHCNAVIVNAGQLDTASHSSHATNASLGDGGAYSPAYLQSAYNVASLSTSQNAAGRIVAVVVAFNDPMLVSDLAHYRRSFNLPTCPRRPISEGATSCSIQVVNQNGAQSPLPAPSVGWSQEASIDVDMVSALCPTCQILVLEAKSSAMSDLGAAVNTAVMMGADVVSNSYGTAEYPGEVTDAQLYFNHPGVPIVAAAGESGQGVEFPAAAPNVVAVGGTTLVQRSDTGVRNGFETAWSKTASGCSVYEAKPAWQHNLPCATRSVADVAADANPATGVWIYDSYKSNGSLIAGGTSVAAPIISALFALAKSSNTTNTNPVAHLYQSASALSPITNGAATLDGGYANATGLGSPGASPNSLLAFGVASSN